MYFAVSKVPKSVNIQRYLTSIHVEEWLKHDVYHLRWWILLSLIFIALLAWWILVDKSRLPEVCLYIVFSTLIYMGIHEYGEELTLWDYPTDIIPIFPSLSSINLIILPLAYSLVHQYYKTKKSFLRAALIITAVICFIIEPLLALGGLYELLHWKYYYSFFIYVLVSIWSRVIIIKVFKIAENHRFKI
jgi:Kef-type K+ transport system membrane component KefB